MVSGPVNAAYRQFWGYWAFLVHALLNLRVLSIPPVRTVFHRQIYFCGMEGLGIVVLLGLLSGTAVATQTAALFGAGETSARGLVLTLINEFGPVLAAIILIARSSVAIAAELSLMRTRNETDHLIAMRIPPMNYLVVPRIAAVTLSSVTLTIYFQCVAVTGGIAASALFGNVLFTDQLGQFMGILSPRDIAAAVAKSVCFGLAISTVSCFHGMDVGKSITEIPVAVMRAVLFSLLSVLLIDALFAYIRFAAF